MFKYMTTNERDQYNRRVSVVNRESCQNSFIALLIRKNRKLKQQKQTSKTTIYADSAYVNNTM